MFGFVVAGIAFIALILLLTIKVTPEDSEQKKKSKVKNATPPKAAEPENEAKAHSRSVRLDKMTERLVHLMEDGNVAEIQQAVQNGINLKRPLQDGQTCLMIAVKHNQDPEIIPFLTKNGIDINAVDDKGQTALMLAATFNPSPEITKTLLNNGADKTIKDKSGKTAADYVQMNFDLIDTEIPGLLFVK